MPGPGSTPTSEPPTTASTDVTAVTAGQLGVPDLLGPTGQLANLLPWSLPTPQTDKTCGVYVGERLPPVPRKLADRICCREYVEMAKMLPEFWPVAVPEELEGKRPATRRPKQVTEFHTWLQCCFPELMAYLITIAWVAQDFTDVAWVRYDAAF